VSQETDRHLEQLLDQAGADAQPRRPSWDELRGRIEAIRQVPARRLVLLRPVPTILGMAAMIAIAVGIIYYVSVGPTAQAVPQPIQVVQKDIEITVFNETDQQNTLYMPGLQLDNMGMPAPMFGQGPAYGGPRPGYGGFGQGYGGSGLNAPYQSAGPWRPPAPPPTGPNGTILVKDHRIVMNLQKGDNAVRFTDVAASIDPTSVRFVSVTDPTGTVVVEQNFEFDLATAEALLKRYIDKKIACIGKDGKQYEGYLCSHDGASIVLADRPPSPEGGIRKTEAIPRNSLRAISLAEVPKDLFVKPTLVWKIRTQHAGQHDTTLTYLCGQAKWEASYIAAVTPSTREQGDRLDLQGWVTIDNRSGSTYKDAGIKLIAGDVNRVQDPWAIRMWGFGMAGGMGGYGGAAFLDGHVDFDDVKQFVEKSFFEYHLYTLSAPSTVKDRQIKQLKLLKADDVKATRRYVYDPVPGVEEGQQHVTVRLEFKNEKDNKLGMPLPKGQVRMMQRDADGELQLLNTQEIDHTSKDEEVKLDLGTAFDVMAERVLTNSQRPSHNREIQTIRLRMRNHKNEAIDARFVEHLVPNRNWSITKTTDPWTRKDVNTIHFDFVLAPNAEKEITYTVDYQWDENASPKPPPQPRPPRRRIAVPPRTLR
jgi:hypothetical protein